MPFSIFPSFPITVTFKFTFIKVGSLNNFIRSSFKELDAGIHVLKTQHLKQREEQNDHLQHKERKS